MPGECRIVSSETFAAPNGAPFHGLSAVAPALHPTTHSPTRRSHGALGRGVWSDAALPPHFPRIGGRTGARRDRAHRGQPARLAGPAQDRLHHRRRDNGGDRRRQRRLLDWSLGRPPPPPSLASSGELRREVPPPRRALFRAPRGKTVFLARFITGLRVAGAWIAGATRMDWWRFL